MNTKRKIEEYLKEIKPTKILDWVVAEEEF